MLEADDLADAVLGGGEDRFLLEQGILATREASRAEVENDHLLVSEFIAESDVGGAAVLDFEAGHFCQFGCGLGEEITDLGVDVDIGVVSDFVLQVTGVQQDANRARAGIETPRRTIFCLSQGIHGAARLRDRLGCVRCRFGDCRIGGSRFDGLRARVTR